jgi:hypothetical protein
MTLPLPQSVFTLEEIIANRLEWTTALRAKTPSGCQRYRQHRGSMASNSYSSFCCLGVAAYKVVAIGAKKAEHGSFVARDRYCERMRSTLSLHACATLGLSNNMQDFLAELNDVKVPFPVIADVIDLLPVVSPFEENSIRKWRYAEFSNRPDIKALLSPWERRLAFYREDPAQYNNNSSPNS